MFHLYQGDKNNVVVNSTILVKYYWPCWAILKFPFSVFPEQPWFIYMYLLQFRHCGRCYDRYSFTPSLINLRANGSNNYALIGGQTTFPTLFLTTPNHIPARLSLPKGHPLSFYLHALSHSVLHTIPLLLSTPKSKSCLLIRTSSILHFFYILLLISLDDVTSSFSEILKLFPVYLSKIIPYYQL